MATTGHSPVSCIHAADCQLRGVNSGFGALEPPRGLTHGGVACTVDANTLDRRPRSRSSSPITPSASSAEESRDTHRRSGRPSGDVETTLPSRMPAPARPTTTTRSAVARGTVPWHRRRMTSQTFSFNIGSRHDQRWRLLVRRKRRGLNRRRDRRDSSIQTRTRAPLERYSATINWGDGSSSAGTIRRLDGNFAVTGEPQLRGRRVPHQREHPLQRSVTNQGSSTVTDSATITSAPSYRDRRASRLSSSSTKCRFRWDPSILKGCPRRRTSSSGSTAL